MWMCIIYGIGFVIVVGFFVYIDIYKVVIVGVIWKFVGIDGVIVWNKGEKCFWNVIFKILCFKIGEFFVKISNSDKFFYGKLYRECKVKEIVLNE